MIRHVFLLVLWLGLGMPSLLVAQTAGGRPGPPPDHLAVRGVGMAGLHWFSAAETFKAVTGTSSSAIYGGGVRVDIPGGAFAEIGAWKYSKDGERVFVTAARQVFPLGIPTTVEIVPLEITLGWRFQRLFGHVTPHVGAGYTSLRYQETADFADPGDDISERYNGFHLTVGAEVRLHRWVGVASDVVWTSVQDGLGNGGSSQAFGEDNLGGTSVRLKILIGR